MKTSVNALELQKLRIEGIAKASKAAGSARCLAEILGITKSALTHWKRLDGVVPATHCPVIERLTNREVQCEQLNHEVDWGFVRLSLPVSVVEECRQ